MFENKKISKKNSKGKPEINKILYFIHSTYNPIHLGGYKHAFL